MAKKRQATPVSRSVYQKLKEDHKRLLRDLEIICYNSGSFEAIKVRKKWHDHFEEKERFNQMMKRIANQALLVTERKRKMKIKKLKK